MKVRDVAVAVSAVGASALSSYAFVRKIASSYSTPVTHSTVEINPYPMVTIWAPDRPLTEEEVEGVSIALMNCFSGQMQELDEDDESVTTSVRTAFTKEDGEKAVREVQLLLGGPIT